MYGGQFPEIATSPKTTKQDNWDVEVRIGKRCRLSPCNGKTVELFSSALLAIETGKIAAKMIVDRLSQTKFSRLSRRDGIKGFMQNPCHTCAHSSPNHSSVCVSCGNLSLAGGSSAALDKAEHHTPATPFISVVGNWIKRAGSAVSLVALVVFATLTAWVLKILFHRAFSRFDDDEFC